MWKFDDKEDLDFFIECNTNAVIGVFLDDGLNMEKLRAVHESKAGFDNRVGASWHLLLPHKEGGLTPDFGGSEHEGYDFALALQLAEEFRVDPRELPAFVFADPNAKDSAFIVSIADLTTEQTTEVVRGIAEITTRDRERTGGDELVVAEQIAEIRVYVASKTLFRGLPRLTGAIGGIARMFM